MDSDNKIDSPALIVKEAYTIDTLIPYEEYVLTQDTPLNIGPLSNEQGKQFRQLLEEFSDLFATDISELGRTDLVAH